MALYHGTAVANAMLCIALYHALYHANAIALSQHSPGISIATELQWQCYSVQGPALTCTSAHIGFALIQTNLVQCVSLPQFMMASVCGISSISPHHLTLRCVAGLYHNHMNV